jgi:hypothetical protein
VVNILTTIKEKYHAWKDRRFLKRHGVETWAQYNRQYDPDINWRATRVNDFYHGYPYVYCFENREHEVYYWDLAVDGTYVVDNWCKENCKDKFRLDCHRVIKYPSTANRWEFNDLGGGDYIFAAFKNPKDYTWFVLRWSE